MQVAFADTEGSFIELQVSPIIEAAVRVLRPNQANQSVEAFYRQQAWHAIQVGVACQAVYRQQAIHVGVVCHGCGAGGHGLEWV